MGGLQGESAYFRDVRELTPAMPKTARSARVRPIPTPAIRAATLYAHWRTLYAI
jgi:hypothetical protein